MSQEGGYNRQHETGEKPLAPPQQHQQVNHVPGPLQNRHRSAESLLSAGIGDSSQQLPPAPPLPRLYPEGGAEVDEPVFDCIVYLIFCPEHGNLAVGKVAKCGATWLPFVALGEGVCWADACNEGVTTLIGRTDAEADAEEAEAMTPTYSLRYLHLLRVQLPVLHNGGNPSPSSPNSSSSSSRTALRIAVFVLLEGSTAFRCCQNSDRVDWLPLSYIYASTASVDRVWGPELWVLPMLLNLQPGQQQAPESVSVNTRIIIRENSFDTALYYLEQQEQTAEEHRLLRGARLTRGQVLHIYTDFVEHCWPAFYMCFEAFRSYLLKYGHSADTVLPGSTTTTPNSRLRRLFGAFCTPGYPYVDFHCFLLGLVAMEPTTSSSLTWRLYFLFRYYASGQTMSSGELTTMLAEANASNRWTLMRAAQEAEAILLSRSASVLTREAFIEEFSGASGERLFADLCRHPKSILLAMAMASSSSAPTTKEEHRNYAAIVAPIGFQPAPSFLMDSAESTRNTRRGSCWSCRRQQYEYGTHYVTMGSDGRCMEARLMQKVITAPGGEDRRRHSLECVFTIGSVPNTFMDLIRDFFEKQVTLRLSGLLSTEPEWPIFAKYLGLLVKEFAQLAAQEDKLLKVNGPAVVVGALSGSLQDLLAIQRHFYPSFPVISESALLFLGGYSGEGGFSVEVLVYLLSLKLCSPNKVYLLRGGPELKTGVTGVLRQECTTKYGPVYGAVVHNLLLSVFFKLPIAALVDDSILCTHSGIPAAGESGAVPRTLDGLLTLPNELPDLGKESSLAYEIVTRCPAEKVVQSGGVNEQPAKKEVKKTPAGANKQGTSISKTTKTTGSDISLAVTCSEEGVRGNRSRDELKNLQIGSPFLKLKPTFLCSMKSKRVTKPMQMTTANCLQLPSALVQSTVSGGGRGCAINSSPFSRQELLDFLDGHDLAFLIRTTSFSASSKFQNQHSCPEGFRIHLGRRCLTIRSCSTPFGTVDKRKPQTSSKQTAISTAVVLIDRTECNLRCVRYDCHDVTAAG